jgi:hypothetical protein
MATIVIGGGIHSNIHDISKDIVFLKSVISMSFNSDYCYIASDFLHLFENLIV